MRNWISVAGADADRVDPVTELESLGDWLRGEPELAGRVRRKAARPTPGEMGALPDLLIVSGAALPVLAGSLRAWLIHRRRSGIAIKVHRADGGTVEIDAKNVSNTSVEEILRQALRTDEPAGGQDGEQA
ncbi:effector-associated constant component EACC1 [Streptomyces sp. P1-3]|uniref:effector-associated constant component EACC1 n=1 Tax=Streptomyces sp. P1-3 TaxID=3421658 RepID=UPI003D36D53F